MNLYAFLILSQFIQTHLLRLYITITCFDIRLFDVLSRRKKINLSI